MASLADPTMKPLEEISSIAYIYANYEGLCP